MLITVFYYSFFYYSFLIRLSIVMDKFVLKFSSCLCCRKTFNFNDLIETASNSLLIGNQTLDICDMVLELFLVKVSCY
jgi:hypothetical protein